MTILADKLFEAGLADRVLTDGDLANLMDITDAARYGLVNKALKKNELIRIRRGLYLMSEKYRRQPLSKFYLASRIVPHSYISLESALSFYGWIPEGVVSTTSILAEGRTKKFVTPFGEFDYYQLPVNEYEFLSGVIRIEDIKNEPYFIATPLRALADFIYLSKTDWKNLRYLTEGLRIDIELLMQLNDNDFKIVQNVHQTKRVQVFLNNLKQELKK